MSFNYIINLFSIFLLFSLFSCQSNFLKKDINNQKLYTNKVKIEQSDKIDLSTNYSNNTDIVDYYTSEEININLVDKNIKKIKIKNNLSNLIYDGNFIYSINSKNEILKYDEQGNLISKILIENKNLNEKEPITFSYLDGSYIIGYKTGKIIRINEKGEEIWSYEKNDFLNTPLKISKDYVFVLYSNEFVVLSSINGNLIYNKKYNSSKIIQSSGGKLANYFNIIYFILPNSSFNAFDTFLFDSHSSKLDDIELDTSLNNLNDNIYVYKNLFVYIDNGKFLNTFDLKNDKFLLNKYNIINSNSYYLFNNVLISKYLNEINLYNIQNGNLFFKINTEKKIRKDSKIIKVLAIKNKLHVFTNYGKIIIIHNNQIESIVDLKIKNIDKIYNFKGKLFISTKKGMTYIF